MGTQDLFTIFLVVVWAATTLYLILSAFVVLELRAVMERLNQEIELLSHSLGKVCLKTQSTI